MNRYCRGAFTPLLFCWRRLAALAGVLLLSACSSQQQLPPFTASGYVADQGAVRIWRKDSSDDNTHILAVFSPWREGATTVSEYRWHNDQLTFLELNISDKNPEQIKLRFASNGELSFMQREVNAQKQQLSEDQIALYHYRARQIKEVSEALRVGHVVLHQGRWNGNDTVTTCEGAVMPVKLDNESLRVIEQRQGRSAVAVSIAWLEAPEGSQLLLVANENFCTWQPKADDF